MEKFTIPDKGFPLAPRLQGAGMYMCILDLHGHDAKGKSEPNIFSQMVVKDDGEYHGRIRKKSPSKHTQVR